MDRAWLNAAAKLDYRDPKSFLRRLRVIEGKVTQSVLPKRVKSLRTHELKPWRELRDAALFCVGLSERMGTTIFIARSESQDYDFIAMWDSEDGRHFAPVQLKEVVPIDINPHANVQATIDALPGKYVDSKGLTVALALNQRTPFDPAALRIPEVNIAALWVFGGLAPDATEWGLWGDFLGETIGTRFAYPV